jgi:hypothetical protein
MARRSGPNLRAFEELHHSKLPWARERAQFQSRRCVCRLRTRLVPHCRGDEVAADRAEQLPLAPPAGHDQSTRMEGHLYSAWPQAMRGDAEGCRTTAGACAAIAARLETKCGSDARRSHSAASGDGLASAARPASGLRDRYTHRHCKPALLAW